MPKTRPLNRADIAFLYRMIAEAIEEQERGLLYRRKKETDGGVALRQVNQFAKRTGITPREVENVLLNRPVTVLDAMYPVVRERKKRAKRPKFTDADGETTPLIGRGDL